MKHWFEKFKVCFRKGGVLIWPIRLKSTEEKDGSLTLELRIGGVLKEDDAPTWKRNIKNIFEEDSSLTWKARAIILTIAFFAALLLTKCLKGLFIFWFGANLNGSDIFQSAITLGLFGMIFGLGNWIIKNHDVKKQFKDTSIEKNELLFSNAVKALFDKSSADDNTMNIHGLKEIARLSDKELIERDRIEAVTAAGHNFNGANLDNAALKGLDLKSVQLAGAFLVESNLQGTSLMGANLHKARLQRANLQWTDLRYADLQEAHFEGANLKAADLSHANLELTHLARTILCGADLSNVDLNRTTLKGARYDENTRFPEGFDPEERGLIKV